MTDGADPDPEDDDGEDPTSDHGEFDAEGADGGHYVYVVECADGTYYTGYTTDVRRRVAEHDRGDGAKYTRGRTPVELRHVESFPDRSAAMRREHEIKSLSRAGKERLLDGD